MICAVSHDLAIYMREQELSASHENYLQQLYDTFADAAADDPGLIAAEFDDNDELIAGLALARTSSEPAMRSWYRRCLDYAANKHEQTRAEGARECGKLAAE